MTAYHGGKQRIGKELSEIIYDESLDIEDEYDFTIKGYCEPFSGMLGVYRHIPELFKETHPKMKYVAGEINESVVKMWDAAKKGWKPPTKTTKKEFERLKKSPPSSLKGYVGHQYSYGGQYFQGYAPSYGNSKYSTKASKRVIDIAKQIKNVQLKQGDYTQFSKLKGYIIYCDPPYEKTRSQYYKNRGTDENKKNIVKKFNTEKFYEWCRFMSEKNIIFVSGYMIPKDFECIFQSTHKLSGHKIKNRNRTEKLYIMY